MSHITIQGAFGNQHASWGECVVWFVKIPISFFRPKDVTFGRRALSLVVQSERPDLHSLQAVDWKSTRQQGCLKRSGMQIMMQLILPRLCTVCGAAVLHVIAERTLMQRRENWLVVSIATGACVW